MIIQKPTKVNFTVGRKGYVPLFICCHIGDGNQKSIYYTFTNPAERRSTHYSVDTNGEVWQFVDEKDTAWGNGILYKPSAWMVNANKGINPNLISISIEHAGWGWKDITEEQYQATAQLIKEICGRWSIPIDRMHIIRHNEINRAKACPGKISVEKIIMLARDEKPAVANTVAVIEISRLQKMLDELKVKFNLLLEKLKK